MYTKFKPGDRVCLRNGQKNKTWTIKSVYLKNVELREIEGIYSKFIFDLVSRNTIENSEYKGLFI